MSESTQIIFLSGYLSFSNSLAISLLEKVALKALEKEIDKKRKQNEAEKHGEGASDQKPGK